MTDWRRLLQRKNLTQCPGWVDHYTIKDAAKDVALDAGKVAAGQVDLVPPAPPGDMLLEPELDEQAPAQPSGGAATASGGGKATGGGSRP
ncbi:hypothethical protein [Ralstonia solanacearum PSI07]|nr:hypothethical protein [Ralstonia solanacearum PSI07]